jgi:hypothetical protein
MVRAKHGNYNQERHLPDNRMKPQGSGNNVWLNEQVLDVLGHVEGQHLIDQSAQHSAKRYEWLCVQLIDRGYKDVVEEYKVKQKEDAAQRRLQDRINRLENLREQLEENEYPSRATYLRKEIEKCEKYIREHTQS